MPCVGRQFRARRGQTPVAVVLMAADTGETGDEVERRVLAAAAQRAKSDAAAERANFGLLPPCRSLNPLWPPLSLVEYEMMERDTAKYLLYHAAIDAAARDISARLGTSPSGDKCALPLLMVVVGGGGGRLVESAVAACTAHGGPGSAVLALDANALAVQMLRQRFAKLLDTTGACGYNRPCAHQYVGKSQSCMVQNGRLIPHVSYHGCRHGLGARRTVRYLVGSLLVG